MKTGSGPPRGFPAAPSASSSVDGSSMIGQPWRGSIRARVDHLTATRKPGRGRAQIAAGPAIVNGPPSHPRASEKRHNLSKSLTSLSSRVGIDGAPELAIEGGRDGGVVARPDRPPLGRDPLMEEEQVVNGGQTHVQRV